MSRTLAVLWLLCLSSATMFAQIDARMLQYPDVSQTHIVFSYGGDLWVVAKEGGTAARLSSPRGQELFPRFSPDGSRIAFNASYDGNPEAYVLPTFGGVPERVTYHGMPDRVIDWYPDGGTLLTVSSMNSGRQRYNQFFRVSVTGGLPDQLPIPYGEMASLSPDGKKIAYTTKTQAFRTWKRYRGGWASDITIFDLEKKTASIVAPSTANDEFPMWRGTTLYFLSDRGEGGRNNLWSIDLNSGALKQITRYTDYDIHFPSIGPSDIVFEKGGRLYLLGLADERVREVPVKVVTDAMTLLPRTVKVGQSLSNITISPDGKQALAEARGELFALPAEHGPVTNLTRTSGIAERFPSWSPDGRRVAYWSDKTGEYELCIRDMNVPGSERTLTSYGPGFRYNLSWSPNSERLAFIGKDMQIRIYDVVRNTTTDVDRQSYHFQGALQNFRAAWSSDSRWLAYAVDLENRSSAIVLFDTKEGKRTQVTSGYYPDAEPSFDPDGKYLYFLTGRTLAPVYSDVDNTWIYPNTTSIAAVPLAADTPSPVAPRNDTTAVTAEGTKKAETKDKDKKEDKKEEKPAETRITLDGFEQRTVLLPPAAGNIARVHGVAGKVVFHRMPNAGSADKKRPLMLYDLEKREEKTILDDVDWFQVSSNGKKVLVRKGGDYAVVEVADGQKMEKKLPTGRMEMTVDPKAEWKQIFSDVWRFERDFFYDPDMHGVPWEKMRAQYAALLENAVTRWDVNFVIGELIGELNASHTYRGGGDADEGDTRAFGYLGVDWEAANGYYRIKKIITAAPWDTEVRSPLADPALKVREGDFVISVNGIPLDAGKAPWASFAGLADQAVELLINTKPSAEGSRKVIVQLLSDETRLRHLAWIEANRKRVDELSKGRVGYVYVPSTAVEGQTELLRQFAAQYTREGLVIDERFNSGGQIPDRFIELLNRQPLAYWAVRDGKTWQWPPMAHFGAKAMLINGWSGSGGDAFPDYFRKAGLGPLVGTRTWGGLIGISGAPSLIDGGMVTVPTFRMYNPDGTWFKEGHGVDPDIEVMEDPAMLAKGVDPQLERAVQEVLRQMKEKPYQTPKRPPSEKR